MNLFSKEILFNEQEYVEKVSRTMDIKNALYQHYNEDLKRPSGKEISALDYCRILDIFSKYYSDLRILNSAIKIAERVTKLENTLPSQEHLLKITRAIERI